MFINHRILAISSHCFSQNIFKVQKVIEVSLFFYYKHFIITDNIVNTDIIKCIFCLFFAQSHVTIYNHIIYPLSNAYVAT